MQREIQQGSLLTSVFLFKKINSTNKFMGIPGLAAVHVKKQLGFLLTTDSLWGINGMWLIKTKVRAVLDHSHKSSVQIRGWQLNPVLVGSHWSSVCTSRHPFHCRNMAPLTRFIKACFLTLHLQKPCAGMEQMSSPSLCKAGMSRGPGPLHRFQLCQLCAGLVFYCGFLLPGTQA